MTEEAKVEEVAKEVINESGNEGSVEETSKANVEGAKGGSASKEGAEKDSGTNRPGEMASDKVKQGMASAKSNLGAVKAHGEKKKELEAAKELLGTYEFELNDLEKEYARRTRIEENYDSIMEEQTSIRSEAQSNLNNISNTIQALKDELAPHEADLVKMEREHDDRLRPFRQELDRQMNYLNSAKQKLSNSENLLKIAEEQKRDLEKQLKQVSNSIEEADRLADAIRKEADKIRRSQDQMLNNTEYQIQMQRAQSEKQMAQNNQMQLQQQIGMVDQNIMNHTNTVNNDRVEVQRVQGDMDRAQGDLNRETAICDQERAPLLVIINPLKEQLAEWNDAAIKNQEIFNSAQEAIDDTEDVHAHPEVIEKLSKDIGSKKKKISDQNQLIGRLAKEEAEIGEAARKGKMIIGGIIAAAVLIIALVVLIASMVG